MMEYKAGVLSLSKTSLLNRFNIQSSSLLQYLQYDLNKRSPNREDIQKPFLQQEEEFQNKWERQFLKQLQEELNTDQPSVPCFKNEREIEYRGDRLSRQIHVGTVQKSSSKCKKKEFQKYKAYAVKLKIPSFNQLKKPTTRDDRRSHFGNQKNTVSNVYLKQIQDLINPQLGFSLKESTKQHMRARNYQSINDRQIFKRNVKTTQNHRNMNIRKRSIKHAQKKEEKEVQNQAEKTTASSPSKLATTIKGLKKLKKASGRSSATPYLDSRNLDLNQRDSSQEKAREIQVRNATAHEKGTRSPKRLIQKAESIKVDYLQKGISFKRKEKESSKQVQNLNQKKISAILSKKMKKQGSLQHMNEGGTKDTEVVVRETPRNFLLQSIIIPKDAKMRKTQNMDEIKSVSKEQKRYKETNRIITFNSEDKYIRRILLSLGWVLNPDSKSKYYHLKWVFKPSAEDYNLIREGQYINHIKNSHELTSKHCLNKNLKAFFSQWTSLYDFYPQCYDISKPAEKQQFFEEYTKQFMMLLLRKIYQYVQTKQFEMVQQLRQKYQKLLGSDQRYQVDTKIMSLMRKKHFRNIEMENYKCFRAGFTLHINLLTAALKYWRFVRKQQEFQVEEGYHFLNYNQKEFENNMGYLERYSQMSTPTFVTDSLQYFTKEFYSTPSNIVIERIVKEYVYFHRKYAKRWSVFGDGNIWIVKPCSASRGNGIYLENNCKQILFNSKGIQSRIVQKYIQRPLLFKNPAFPQICNRKFDIRQWVLLRSVDPLEIHMFSHCYVRICSEDYNIENINNLKSHLTNYSFNKQYFKNPAESVLDYSTFKSMLKEEYKVDYEKQIKEKIKKIIIKSIKSAQQLLNDYDKRCFSLLGYDILLDQKFNPWLLEVNMSPACEQRTQWLKNYLKEMGKGMLKIVLPKQYLQIQREPEVLQNDTPRQKQKRIAEKQKEGVQLKRIKTEMSHELLPQFGDIKSNIQFNQSKIISYDPPEIKMEIEEDIQRQSIVQQQEQQITYQDFVKQNLITEDEQPQNNQNQQQNQQEIQYAPNESTLGKVQILNNYTQNQKLTSQDKNMRMKSLISLPTESNRLKSQPNEIEGQSEENQQSNNRQHQLKWELICFEEYHLKKKQFDGLIEVTGVRIGSEAIRSNDIKIDQFQETRDQILRSIIKIQSKIKHFLKNRQRIQEKEQLIKVQKQEQLQKLQQVIQSGEEINEQSSRSQKEDKNIQNQAQQEIQSKEREQKQSLKLNFSHMIPKLKSQRKARCRSVMMEGEVDSIWHYSYVHTYRQGVIQKVQIEKYENAKKSPKHKRLKNFYENKVKDRFTSAAVNSVADVSVLYLQQIRLSRINKQLINDVKEHKANENSIEKLEQVQKAQNESKQALSQNYIE